MRRLVVTNACKKDIRQLKKRGYRFHQFYQIVELLKAGKPIPKRYQPHPLKGKWRGYFDCHVKPDWILIWKEDKEIVYLARTGSHSDLFK